MSLIREVLSGCQSQQSRALGSFSEVQKLLAPFRWLLLSKRKENFWGPLGTAASSIIPDTSSPGFSEGPELLPARASVGNYMWQSRGFLPVPRELVVFIAAIATTPIQLPVKNSTTRNPLLLLCSDPCLSPVWCTVGGPEPRSATDLLPSLCLGWRLFQWPRFLTQAHDRKAKNPPVSLSSPKGMMAHRILLCMAHTLRP